MRILIIDDEAPARRKMRRFVADLSDWDVLGEADDLASAVTLIQSTLPDLILLDIQLGTSTGFEVLEQLRTSSSEGSLPVTVFVTAYDEFALRAFEVNAQDYLLKPVTRERFAEMVRRVSGQRDSQDINNALQGVLKQMQQKPWLRRIVLEDNQRERPVPVSEIIWIQSERNYVRIHTPSGSFKTRTTLASLGARLDPSSFAQVNRSAWVNLDAVREIQTWFRGDRMLILSDKSEVRASRSFLNNNPVLAELIR